MPCQRRISHIPIRQALQQRLLPQLPVHRRNALAQLGHIGDPALHLLRPPQLQLLVVGRQPCGTPLRLNRPCLQLPPDQLVLWQGGFEGKEAGDGTSNQSINLLAQTAKASTSLLPPEACRNKSLTRVSNLSSSSSRCAS